MTLLLEHFKAIKRSKEDPMVVMTKEDIDEGNAKGKCILVETQKRGEMVLIIIRFKYAYSLIARVMDLSSIILKGGCLSHENTFILCIARSST